MKTLAVWISLICAWSLSAQEPIPAHRARQIHEAAPDEASVPPERPRRVLVWITPPHLMEKDPHKGYCIPYGTEAMKVLGKKTGAYEPVVSGDLAMYLPENIGQFDAIVMNNSSRNWITPTSEHMKRPAFRKHGTDVEAVEKVLRQSLLDYVRRGGGIMALHYAIGANRHWPEFHELLGAGYWGHPWNEEVGITVEEPEHPLSGAFEGNDFRIADEIYQFREPYSRDEVRVLLSLDPERSNMGVKWIHRDDNDFAVAWVKKYVDGRVFYTSFGHRTELYWDPRILEFYLDGIQFAIGDLKAPAEPREGSPPARRAPGATPPSVVQERMQAKKVRMPTAEEVDKIRDAAPAEPAVAPAKKRKVLIWGHLWTHPPTPFSREAFRVLGEKSGAYEPVLSDDPRLLLGDRLSQFDALVMNNIHERRPFLPDDYAALSPEKKQTLDQFDAAVKASILEYVRGGKGIVGVHAATAAFQSWPEYGEMMGGYYGGHIHEEVTIGVEDPGHPVNACFHGESWKIKDEVYMFREPYSRKNARVLLGLDLDQMRDPGKREDGDYPVSWVRPYGEGRVFYTTLGHAYETYWHPKFLRHLLAGIQFAVGDLKGPVKPLAKGEESDSPEDGFIALFNGKDLTGWKGDERIWSVRDGAITGETTETVKVKENNFLIWQGGQPRDFELKLKYRLNGGNSGVYFHAEKRAPGADGEPLVGPQADFSADHRWTGVLMEYTKRGVLAERGQRVLIDEQGNKKQIGSVGDPDELLRHVKDEGWNDYHLLVQGERVVLRINGVVMCEVIDKDTRRTPEGYLALQTHQGPPMTVQFKEIYLKPLKP